MAFAPRTTRAEDLTDRVAFDQRQTVTGDYGETTADFAEQFIVYARISRNLGGERIIAARLEGAQPIMIIVRSNSDTVQIEPDWRARDVRTGEVFNIRSIAEQGNFLAVLCESGVTT